MFVTEYKQMFVLFYSCDHYAPNTHTYRHTQTHTIKPLQKHVYEIRFYLLQCHWLLMLNFTNSVPLIKTQLVMKVQNMST